MAKFKCEFDFEVLDHDQSVVLVLPDVLRDRFDGSAIRIDQIVVTKGEGATIELKKEST